LQGRIYGLPAIRIGGRDVAGQEVFGIPVPIHLGAIRSAVPDRLDEFVDAEFDVVPPFSPKSIFRDVPINDVGLNGNAKLSDKNSHVVWTHPQRATNDLEFLLVRV
jgi:hypothetical protein